jgi:hypothetical protein
MSVASIPAAAFIHSCIAKATSDCVEKTKQRLHTMADLPPEHADMVAEFCGITNAAPNVAQPLLAALDWNLESALELYFSEPETAAAAAAGARTAGVPSYTIDELPGEGAAQQAAAGMCQTALADHMLTSC